MKPLFLRFSSVLLVAAASASAQTAETRIFRAVLSPLNEVPAITDYNASGTATIIAHVVRDSSGKIVSGTADFHVTYRLPGEATIVGLHIHSGAAGVNGPVTLNTGISGTNSVAANGAGVIDLPAQALPATAPALATLEGMFTDPSNYYANMHTMVYPGGIIRGQLKRAEWNVGIGLMSTANEVPAIENYNASAVGAVTTIITRRPDGSIDSGEVIFNVNYSFPSKVTFTGLHIHTGLPGVNGPVTLNSSLARIDSADSGVGTLTYRNEIDVTNAASVAALEGQFRNPAGYYINLHTTDYPGGVVRSPMRSTDATTLSMNMLPSNEVPAITGLDASGPSLLHVRTLRDAAGAPVAAWMAFDVNYRFPAAIDFQGLHVHTGKAGENGAVRLNSGLSGTNRVSSTTGFGNIFIPVLFSGDTMPSMAGMLTSPEAWYLNIHTPANPGGAIRAQTGDAMKTPRMGAVISASGVVTKTTGSPGALMSLYGADFSPTTTDLSGWAGAALPKSLNGVSVKVGSNDAPLLLISPSQVTFQVPVETANGAIPVTITNSGGTGSGLTMQVAANDPAVFIYDGNNGIVVKNADFSLVSATNAATAGDILVVYTTGMGQTTPATATGEITPNSPLRNTAATTVTIAGVNAPVIYSLASPGFAGLYQTAIRVPAGLSAGNQPLVLTVNNVASNSVNIMVR
ncbi:MAG TPA: CHRD domain-containing protein [Bryobacteraceae bacterium]|nr:CHRD domain-containing protein [Bryobacteraceae bacterium]